MSKKFKLVYIIVFFFLCTLPMVLMPFLKNNAQIEKRQLAKLPAYIQNGKLNIDFSDGFESWLNDRMPLRSYLLTAANFLKGELLHTPSSNVVVGRDGWLFYNSESADYMDVSAMTDHQAAAVAITLSLIEEHVGELGGHFTFVAMPNKSTIYGENMSVFFRKGEDQNIDRVQSAMERVGVTYTDLKKLFTDNKDLGLYHVRDSHWNYQGALMGYNAIMDSLGREHPTYEDAAYTVEKSWRGDLDKLLYPAGGTLDDQYIYDIAHDDFSFIQPAGVRDPGAMLENFMSDREEGDDLFTTKNEEKNDGSSLYMARDSFGRAVLPFFIDAYETATFKRTDCPDLNSVTEGMDVVYEIAERNLSRVIQTAPFMNAPRRDAVPAGNLIDGGSIEMVTEKAGYGISLYGALPEMTAVPENDPNNVRVYIRLTRGEETVIFEAFPIYEAKRLPAGGTCGFSAILGKEEGLSGTYEVEIITGGVIYHAGSVVIE